MNDTRICTTNNNETNANINNNTQQVPSNGESLYPILLEIKYQLKIY